MKKVLVLIPTFNEVENIGKLIKGIFGLDIPNMEVLVVDDNSSDGTVELVRRLKSEFKRINILLRKSKVGIGSAHLAGIKWAYRKGFDFLITMDADLTHSPSYIPDLIEHLSDYDLVIASRHLKGSKMTGWSFFRRILTFLNHFWVSFFFSLEVDTSNAFRAYNLKRIPKSIFERVSSSSYNFFFESLVYLKENGISMYEIPIVMREREAGRSKLSLSDFFSHIKVFLKMFSLYYLRKSGLRVGYD